MSPDGEALEGIGADAGNGWMRMTEVGEGWKFAPTWSPDSKHIVFSTYEGKLYWVDIEANAVKQIARRSYVEELGAEFSPNSRWLTWSMAHATTDNSAVHLYDLENQTMHVVTSGMFEDDSPTFDLNGDWLYYTSARTFQPTYADLDDTWIYQHTKEVVAVPLRADVESPFAHKDTRGDWGSEGDEDSEEGDSEDEGEEETDESSKDADAEDAAEEESSTEEEKEVEEEEEEEEEDTSILIEGFESRGRIVDFEHQSLIGLVGLDSGLAFLEMPETGRSARGSGASLGSIKLEPDAEPEAIIGNLNWAGFGVDRTKVLVRSNNQWALIDVAPKQTMEEPLDFSGVRGVFDPQQEWAQMLRDTYRLYRDYFYDAGMHGVDWKAEYERFAAMLPNAGHREDLHYLLGEMIGELNVGHAYNRGGAESRRPVKSSPGIGMLGCDWELHDGAYRIKRILGTPYDIDQTSPLSDPGVDVKKSEYLLAVDGIPVDTQASIFKAFVGKANRLVRLEVNTSPTRDGNEREVTVRPTRGEGSLRYRTWVHDMRQMVHELSDGRVGYLHVPDTGIRGQNELMRQFVATHNSEALIVDERWNGGGQIPWRFVELLDRPTLNYWATRGQKDWEFPGMKHNGPKAMLINGPSGSGGDCFPYYFKQKGLGPLIGTRTWGGLVGISGNPSLVDGSNTSIPTFGFFELDGTWGIENHGVDPDIEVIEDPANMLNGRDPQIEVAVQHLLKELEANPRKVPSRPAGPIRSGAGIPAEER